MIQRTFVAVAFALALLFAQQGGLAHGLSHLARAPAPADQHLPHGKACPDCVVFAEIGAAATATPVAWMPDVARSALVGASVVAPYAAATFPYQSRAPPVLFA